MDKRNEHDLHDADDCEEYLKETDEQLLEMAHELRVSKFDHFSPGWWMTRLLAWRWAKQVTQEEDGRVSSPFLTELAHRADADLGVQRLCYRHIKEGVGRVAQVADGRLEKLGETLEKQKAKAAGPVSVDKTHAAKLSDETATSEVVGHDVQVVRNRLMGEAKATEAQIEAWKAVRLHARATMETAASNEADHFGLVKSHYGGHSDKHMRWAMRKKPELRNPYILPYPLGPANGTKGE